ncbi:MAG: AhpC/TSA family protein [Gemmatimonadota bacterium]|nr:AhpC/TSA family protein [Gemmatimonadota bacterium]
MCRSHLVKMHDRKDRIAELGADVVFVAFDEPDELRAKLVADVDLAFPLAYDPARESYRQWGLQRVAWWKIWLDPGVWKAYARLLASVSGCAAGAPTRFSSAETSW